MTDKQKVEGIAKYLNELIKDTDDLKKCDHLTKKEVDELKAQRSLALEIAIRFHLEENLGE